MEITIMFFLGIILGLIVIDTTHLLFIASGWMGGVFFQKYYFQVMAWLKGLGKKSK